MKIFEKEKFEKDILKVLKSYGIGIELITKLEIKCELEKIPVIKIVYGKQYRSLKTKIKNFITSFILNIKIRIFNQ